MTQSALNIIQFSDGKWKVKDKDKYNFKLSYKAKNSGFLIHYFYPSIKLLPNNEAALCTVSSLLIDKVYKEVVDFDDHLDDISQDWLNTKLNNQVTEVIHSS